MGLRVRARRTRRPAWPERRDMPRPPVLGRTNNAAFSSSQGAVRSQWSWLRLLRRSLPVVALALLLGTVIAGAGPALSALPTGSAVTTAATYGSTLAVSRPTTTNSGDVLIASVYAGLPGSATITPPSGWALIRRDSSTPGYASLTQALYYKVVTPSEPAAYVWSVGSQVSAAGAILDFKGIDTTSPVDSHGGAFTGQSTSFVAPSVNHHREERHRARLLLDELDQDAPTTELDDRGLRRPLGEQALEPRWRGRRVRPGRSGRYRRQECHHVGTSQQRHRPAPGPPCGRIGTSSTPAAATSASSASASATSASASATTASAPPPPPPPLRLRHLRLRHLRRLTVRLLASTFDCYGSTPNCSGSGATCTSTISSGLQTALNSAVGGNVICLNSGSYGAVSLSSKSYASEVIVQPVAGATVTTGRISSPQSIICDSPGSAGR